MKRERTPWIKHAFAGSQVDEHDGSSITALPRTASGQACHRV
jgi:hypothetical protein